jgi:hypothetical protein
MRVACGLLRQLGLQTCDPALPTQVHAHAPGVSDRASPAPPGAEEVTQSGVPLVVACDQGFHLLENGIPSAVNSYAVRDMAMRLEIRIPRYGDVNRCCGFDP